MKKLFSVMAALCIAFAGVQSAWADKSLENKACRSVHLWYDAPEGVAFFTEMKVEQSYKGSYFMATGFNMGYYGIQELFIEVARKCTQTDEEDDDTTTLKDPKKKSCC